MYALINDLCAIIVIFSDYLSRRASGCFFSRNERGDGMIGEGAQAQDQEDTGHCLRLLFIVAVYRKLSASEKNHSDNANKVLGDN